MGTTSIVLVIFLVLYAGFMLYLGNAKLPKEIRESWAPEDLEAFQQELNFWGNFGKILAVLLGFLVVFWLLFD
ncbi:MAG: hypothetical protein EBZ03_09310 [Betaproteobacteria bacterium]|nr:hypothetical protein [Pseudomonadota bacterium]NBO44691.1 hypothetical protein [Betaproteobacteria bacterium]NBP10043.1 hypothetical protein [Betaproteobacteria bacterium]NBP61365.1 hypothetical protein [Betaproteobacteria bacterium]NBQ09987.1 hypothetical protein [Betaproteobacteria bacterium]